MRKLAVLLMLIFKMSFVFCQNQSEKKRITGVVLNKDGNEPLEYVNIGVANKNLGALSVKEGAFTLNIPKDYFADTLTFSMLGYEIVEIPIADFNLKRDTVLLEEKEIIIKEACIVWGKPKTKTIGVLTHNPAVNGMAVCEFAHFFNPRSFPVKVQKIRVHLRANIDSCKFRISFFDSQNGFPGSNISSKDLIVSHKIVDGWNEVDISKYNIVMEKEFFLGIQGLPVLSKQVESQKFWFGAATIGKGKTYCRSEELGQWFSSPPFKMSINITVLFQD